MYKKDIKLMAFVASAMFWGSGWAADNSIYLEQAGDNSTISITQDGAGNKVKGILTNGTAGGTTDPAKLTGDNQTVTIQQTGATNVLSLGVNSTVSSGVGVNLNYSVSDGGNTGYININNNGTSTASNNVIGITQSGGSAITTLNMTGTNNNLSVTQSGGPNNKFVGTINADDTVATVSNTLGGGNETTLNMTGDNGQVSVTTTGATNITSVTQSASGTNGAQTIINLNGSGNTTTVSQSGAADHYARLRTTGSGSSSNTTSITQSGNYAHSADILVSGGDSNQFTVSQSGGNSTTSAGQTLALTVAGGSNIVGVTQQGTVSNISNISITGSSNTYTILQKN